MDYDRVSISHLVVFIKPSVQKGKKWLQISLALLMIMTFAAQPAYSQGESPSGPMPSWTIQTVDGPHFFTNMTDRSLAYKLVLEGGAYKYKPCAAYGGDGLYFACYNFTTEGLGYPHP